MKELPFVEVVLIGLIIVLAMVTVVAVMISIGDYLAKKKKP